MVSSKYREFRIVERLSSKKEITMCVSPGLTSLGTIFFSDEVGMLISAVKFEEFYDSGIILFK